MRNCSVQISNFEREETALGSAERKEMRERRNINRNRLKTGLANKGKPKPIGLHSQGSYAMRTMVQDAATDYDIDDGVYFKASDLKGSQGGEMSALQVRQMICEVLQDNRFNKQPETRPNCVRVFYNEGYHVDVPAYRRIETKDAWSGAISYSYEIAGASWKASDPRAVTDWFKDTNSTLSPDCDSTEGQFRRVVRLVKMFARSRSTWKGKNASGFMITKLAQEHFYSSLGRDDQAVRETMKAIRNRLDYNEIVEHPTLNINISKENDPRPAYFRERLKENLSHLECLDRSDCTHEQAMSAWNKVFNTTWFSDQPEDDGSGTPKKAVDKAGGGRYA
jgi:hypothetical protein